MLFSLIVFSFLNAAIRIDGSSTVYPITEAVAEEFQLKNKDIRVTVGISGTGGGFKKFTKNEIDINNASRSIRDIEVTEAKKNKLTYLEIPVAYDGITIIVNPHNTWAQDITPAELKKIWEPNSTVELWSDIRSSWPKEKIRLYGPGVDSGTFDYFTEAINGKSHVSRSNFTKSEDDNVLVKAVSGDKYSLAFLGYAYYLENKSKLKALMVHNGKKFVLPSVETINNGSYSPLSRKVFIYVSKNAATRPEVQNFINFYLKEAALLSQEVGYIPLSKSEYDKASQQFQTFIQ